MTSIGELSYKMRFLCIDCTQNYNCRIKTSTNHQVMMKQEYLGYKRRLALSFFEVDLFELLEVYLPSPSYRCCS